MTPQFAVGDRVVIQGFHPELDGREGTVTEAEFSAVRAYPYRVRIDNDPNWDGMGGRLFTANELIAVSKPVPEPTPTPQFAPGDRVVYTIPETYGGYPGEEMAARPVGSTGTVIEMFNARAFNVDWDDDGPVPADVAFLAHAPKPTHKYPEGLYRGGTGARVFVQHVEEGRYAVTYVDEPKGLYARTTNPSLPEAIIDYYTLIADAPKA